MKYFKHALITGCSGDLGFALCEYLVKNNICSHLSLIIRSDKNIERLQNLVTLYKAKIDFYYLDIRDDVKMQITIKEMFSLEPLDLVIANAGISLSTKKELYEYKEKQDNKDTNNSKDLYSVYNNVKKDRKNPSINLEDLNEINRAFDVNAKGTIKTIYLVLKEYLSQKSLKKKHLNVVAISSLASLINMPSSPLYCASKCAINSYVNSLEPSFYKYGVKTNLVLPGFVDTDMSRRYKGNKAMIYTKEKAASIIIEGILKNKRKIVFPFILYWGIILLNHLPYSMQKYFIAKFAFSVDPDMENRSKIVK